MGEWGTVLYSDDTLIIFDLGIIFERNDENK